MKLAYWLHRDLRLEFHMANNFQNQRELQKQYMIWHREGEGQLFKEKEVKNSTDKLLV